MRRTFVTGAFGGDVGHAAADLAVFLGVQAGPARLEVGYRVFAWTFDWHESLDLRLHGPTASLIVRF